MGGIMFIIGIVLSIVLTLTLALAVGGDSGLYAQLTSTTPQHRIFTVRMIAGAVMALSFGFIGFIDDYIKVVKNAISVLPEAKTLLQLLVAAAYLSCLALSGDTFTKIPFWVRWMFLTARDLYIGRLPCFSYTDLSMPLI